MKKRIGIVTVLYNSSPVLDAFFASLDRQTLTNFRLYMVDNASPDDSVALARKLSRQVRFETRLITGKRNGGVAYGNNLGIRAAADDGCRWILLSNNDVVLEAETLFHLFTGARSVGAEISVPKILIHGTDRLWAAGGRWNRWRGGTLHRGYGKKDDGRYDAVRRVEYAPSCFMLVRASVFSTVGLMDEWFFLYYDDSDFVLRAARAGKSVWYIPGACLSHKESACAGAGSPFVQYQLARNLLIFTRKHYPFGYWLYVVAVNLLILLLKRTYDFNKEEWQAAWKGYCDGLFPSRNRRSF